MSRVRTRFAPSPTGTLHAGNARTALVNWLVARHHGGAFILRIEDTDVERNVAGAEARLMEDLRWLGLEWDEGPDPDAPGEEQGDQGPYHQSRRLDLYRERAATLLERKAAYRCFCSAETLEAERRRALAEGRSPGYGGTCRGLDPAESDARAEAGERHVVRLATPESGEVVVDDRIRGRVRFDAAEIADFVLLRSDGIPTYNFAVVVDDAAMEISHVIRGAGHLSNTPHQILLYDALGRPAPVFAHTPTILGEDRSKLSKRSGARPVSDWRVDGYHPDGVVNYLSLLGWSSPSGDEVLPRDRLIAEVTLERMNASDAVFDEEKMRWLSGKHIESMPIDRLARAVRPWIRDTPYERLIGPRFETALEAVRSHLATFGEITDHLAPFLGPTEPPGPFDAEAVGVLGAVRETLRALDRWDGPSIQGALKDAGKAASVQGRALYVPVRRAVTGEDHGPPLPAILEVQGRDRVLEHLASAARGGGRV